MLTEIVLVRGGNMPLSRVCRCSYDQSASCVNKGRYQFGRANRDKTEAQFRFGQYSAFAPALLFLSLILNLAGANCINNPQTTIAAEHKQFNPMQTSQHQHQHQHQHQNPISHLGDPSSQPFSGHKLQQQHVREKRWLSAEPAENDSKEKVAYKSAKSLRQSSLIPAANFNFEAAFQGECGKNNKSNPCEQICLDLHDGTYECSCFYGFTLAVDGYSCAQLLITGPVELDNNKPPLAPPITAPSGAPRTNQLEAPSGEHGGASGDVSSSRPDVGGPSKRPDGGQLFNGADNKKKIVEVAGVGDNQKLVEQTRAAESAELNVNEIGAATVANNNDDDDDDNHYDNSSSNSSSNSGSSNGLTEDNRNAGSGRLDESLSATTGGSRRSGRQRRLFSSAGYKSQWLLDKISASRSLRGHYDGASGRQEDGPKGTAASGVAEAPLTTASINNNNNNNDHHDDHHDKGASEQIEGTSRAAWTEQQRQPQQSANEWPPELVTYDLGDNTIPTTADTDSDNESDREPNQSIRGAKIGEAGSESAERAASGIREQLDEPLDPDIRSIMEANDGLVHQLANLVASSHYDHDDAIADDGDSDDDDGDGDQGNAYADGSSENPADYELGRLAELVRKTIEDYARQFNSLLQQTAPSDVLEHKHVARKPASSVEIDLSDESGINELYTNDTGLQIEQNKTDSSSQPPTQTQPPSFGALEQTPAQRPRRSYYNATIGPKRPDKQMDNGDINNNPFCDGPISGGKQQISSAKDKQVYLDCDELPECESGGQCVLELKHQGAPSQAGSRLVRRARCRCPIGRGGQLCQKPIQRRIPKFLGHSYLALPMISDSSLTSLRLVFRPTSSNEPIQMLQHRYQHHHQHPWRRRHHHSRRAQRSVFKSAGSQLLLYSQRFVLLLDDMSRIELRYFDGYDEATTTTPGKKATNGIGKITRVIGSRDVEQNKWNELIVTDASSDSQTMINNYIGDLTRIVLVTPDKIDLSRLKSSNQLELTTTDNSSFTELFVGGMPGASGNLPDRRPHEQVSSGLIGEMSADGFRGCIKELSINSRDYDFRSDFNGDTLDGFDIDECCR